MTENLNLILILDSNRGVYIPHHFGNMMRGYLRSNINDVFDEMLLLEEGNPHDTEGYWDAWNKILDEFWFEDANGQRYRICQSQHGDVWQVPIEEMEDLPEDF